ncbi:MAG: PAAR domain-containing protein [Candidatus Acidiferrum sp.]
MGGFPAARLTDPTVHGGMIVVGCPTVLMTNLPAARIGDMHVCPMITVLVPHIGGPLILGSLTVIVGGVPQSRQTDMLICIGPPDMVMMGDPTVLVGNAGAAGGLGAILGAALSGIYAALKGTYPRAVLMPDGSIATEFSSAITIKGTPQFQATVLARLQKIASTKSGKATIDSINSSGKSMSIIQTSVNNSFCGANNTWKDLAGQSPKGSPVFDGSGKPILGPDGKTQLVGTGDGADTTLQLNPNLTLANPKDPSNPMPNDAVLMHEMTHGSHQMNGTSDCSPAGGGFDTNEEKTTILTGSPSEADYLKETGYPYHRTDHDSTFAPN